MKVKKINPEKYIIYAENKEEVDIITDWSFNVWIDIGTAQIAKESASLEVVIKR